MPKLSHGQSKRTRQKATAVYLCWASMKSRCLSPKDQRYPRYGGRGISVCDRWLEFENFLTDMGERPRGRSLDRIDNDGNYEPGNCRWATQLEQQSNRRSNRLLTFRGETLCMTEWARRIGISAQALFTRLKRGWPVDVALVAPRSVK